jgi:hypothetical protein
LREDDKRVGVEEEEGAVEVVEEVGGTYLFINIEHFALEGAYQQNMSSPVLYGGDCDGA